MQSSHKYYFYENLAHSWNRATQESGKLASHISTFLERKYKVNSTLEIFPRNRVCRCYMLLKTLVAWISYDWKPAGRTLMFFPYNSLTWESSNLEYKHSLLLKQESVSTKLFHRKSTKQQNEALDEPDKGSWRHCSLLLLYTIYLPLSMHGLTDLRLVQIGSNSFDLN